MDCVFGVLLFVLASSSSLFLTWGIDDAHFNVMDYGATNDSQTDSSQAFLKAWGAACGASVESPTLYVPPQTTFLVNPISFKGPCNASIINFLNLGEIISPESPRVWNGRDASQWLAFMNISGLHVDGHASGVVDGQGKGWWDQSCKYHPKLQNCTSLAPTAMKFVRCKDSSIRNMRFINSAQTHILVTGCNNFTVGNVTIESPGNSPNTDGIHISSAQHIHITNSTIACGDDCISIGDQCSDLQISNIQCGPGHGISIGSLGKGGSYVQVENINVTGAIFNGTSNGARIKTWQVGRGYVKNVTFDSLTFNNVQNPIIIDQNYCNVRGACPELKTGVQISNVVYRGGVGTSATELAINLNCSNSVPCIGLSIESVHLTPTLPGGEVSANCRNAYGQEIDVVPGPCLQHAEADLELEFDSAVE